MGAKCSTISREDEEPSTERPRGRVATVTTHGSKDTQFWYEKMRFSSASQLLFDSAVKGDPQLATEALRGLGDPNCCSGQGYRPLQVAISCGNYGLLDLLLKAGADINCHAAGSPPPIVLAAGTGDTAVFERLLAHGADLAITHEPLGETALTRAAERGDAHIVRSALAHGSPGFQKLLAQHTRSGDGATALHLAASGGHRVVCDQLLGVGSQPSVVDKRGRSPVFNAAEGNHVECCNLLLTFGGSPNVSDKEGQSPLHFCSQRGQLAIADLLLRFAGDVNLQRADGRTPLHLAACDGHDVLCRLLIAQAAEPNIEDVAGVTAFALAYRESRVKCCRLLLEAGAEVRAVAPGESWSPPYTEFDAKVHESMRPGKMKNPRTDDSSRDLVGC